MHFENLLNIDRIKIEKKRKLEKRSFFHPVLVKKLWWLNDGTDSAKKKKNCNYDDKFFKLLNWLDEWPVLESFIFFFFLLAHVHDICRHYIRHVKVRYVTEAQVLTNRQAVLEVPKMINQFYRSRYGKMSKYASYTTDCLVAYQKSNKHPNHCSYQFYWILLISCINIYYPCDQFFFFFLHYNCHNLSQFKSVLIILLNCSW